jgi:DNA-binding transcriptional LysR family regulator
MVGLLTEIPVTGRGYRFGMELRHPRYFVAVATEPHFVNLEAELGLSTPPTRATQQFLDLAAELGHPVGAL